METKRTKHNYIYRMTVVNFEDKMALPNTILHNEYRERATGRRRGNTNIFTR